MNNKSMDVTQEIITYRKLVSMIWNQAYLPKLNNREINIECQEGFLEACAYIFGAHVLNISDHTSDDLRLPSKTGYPTRTPARNLYVVPRKNSSIFFQSSNDGIIESTVKNLHLPYMDLFDYDEFGARGFDYVLVDHFGRIGFISFDDIEQFVFNNTINERGQSLGSVPAV
jgi:hypothetical protein